MTACRVEGAARRDGEAATSDLLLPSDLLPRLLDKEVVEAWEKFEGCLFSLDDSSLSSASTLTPRLRPLVEFDDGAGFP